MPSLPVLMTTLLLLCSGTATAVERVASINLCADQLLILLADPVQIVSLSNLSQNPVGSYYFKEAAAYPVNSGLAEEILPLAPDLVIVGEYSAPYTVRLLQQSGLRVETLPIAESIDDMLANLRLVGRWLGREERAERIGAELEARLQAIESKVESIDPDIARPTIAVFDPNGYTVGDLSLRGDLLQRAGWHNIARDKGITGYGKISLETLVLSNPDALWVSALHTESWSRAQMLVQHPVLKAPALAPLKISLHGRNTLCEGPWLVDVLEMLTAQAQVFLDKAQHVGNSVGQP